MDLNSKPAWILRKLLIYQMAKNGEFGNKNHPFYIYPNSSALWPSWPFSSAENLSENESADTVPTNSREGHFNNAGIRNRNHTDSQGLHPAHTKLPQTQSARRFASIKKAHTGAYRDSKRMAQVGGVNPFVETDEIGTLAVFGS